MNSALFSDITQRRVIFVYRRFGTTYRPHFLGLLDSWRWDPIGRSKTSVQNYLSTVRNIPQQNRYQTFFSAFILASAIPAPPPPLLYSTFWNFHAPETCLARLLPLRTSYRQHHSLHNFASTSYGHPVDCFTVENGSDSPSRNVGNQPPTMAL
jgi:hypothetical protein